MTPPFCYVDAVTFPDQVTLTYTYNFSGMGDAPGSTRTKTGSATLPYTRQKLSDTAALKSLPLNTAQLKYNADESIAPGTFIAYQLGTGLAPGWIAQFIAPAPVVGAYTVTTTGSDGTVVTTHEDQYSANFTLTCTQAAEGVKTRDFFAANVVSDDIYVSGNIVSQNTAVVPADYEAIPQGVAYGVTLIQPGIAADKKSPAVLPVYRITLPQEAAFIFSMSVGVNGDTVYLEGQGGAGGGGPSSIRNYLNVAFESGVENVGLASSLSPWVCDVQMSNVTDVLSAGTVSYIGFQTLPSQVILLDAADEDGDASAGTFTIDPFNLGGQSYTTPQNDAGLSITISF